MKCICGYSDDRVMDKPFSVVFPVSDNEGLLSFVKLPDLTMDALKKNENKSVQLYACPKCGTVRIE